MEEANETLWRSVDSSFDMMDALSAEVSFKSLPGSRDDASEYAAPAVTPQKSDVSLGEGLIDALRNLQIASARKTSKFRPPMTSTADPQESEVNGHSHPQENPQINDFVPSQPVESPEEIQQLVEHLLQQIEPADLQPPSVSVEPPQESSNFPTAEENPLVTDDEIQKDPEEKKTSESTRTEPTSISIAPEILDNMKKALKPLLKPPTAVRKVTKGVSPMLQTRARCRVPKTSSLTQLNQPTTINQNKKKLVVEEPKRSSSVKRQPPKNIVATVVATKDGIKLKEEKISNFGIPVNIERKKKRTQAVPFSFATREKSSLQGKSEEKGQQKLPMRDSNSVNQQKQPVIMKSGTKENAQKLLPMAARLATKSSLRTGSNNKENRSTNLSNPLKTVNGGSKSNVGSRLPAESNRIDPKKSQKERMTDVTALKKKIDSKAISKPAVKIPAPVQPRKPVTTQIGK